MAKNRTARTRTTTAAARPSRPSDERSPIVVLGNGTHIYLRTDDRRTLHLKLGTTATTAAIASQEPATRTRVAADLQALVDAGAAGLIAVQLEQLTQADGNAEAVA